MEFEEQRSAYGDGDNIEELLDDLALEDNTNTIQTYKNDSTMFIVDCCPQMLIPHQGQVLSQMQKILKGYANFMMSKIISNSSDRVGLIFCNVKNFTNSLSFDYIHTVQSLQAPSAQTIKSANSLLKDFDTIFGISQQKSSLHQVLWLYNHQIKDLDSNKYHLRLFFFTADDCPHAIGDDKRDQAISHARQLAQKNVQIQLFPIKKTKRSNFDIKRFYQEIISFDLQDLNQTAFDSSSKIMDLQSRLRQKQYKKRTLNRLLLKIGKQAQIGVKIYSGYAKAKKPLCKKVQAKTNKLLQRVTKKLNSNGDILFDGQIGTYYPLGGQKIKLSKQDMNKIKNLQQPGMTLMGFKPKSYIKPYYNMRTSYFLYPDQDYVSGSSQFFDALISQLSKKNMVGIVKIVPRANQQLRFAAILPQQQKYDQQDHFQTPPGFNMIFLPFADDIASFIGNKVHIQPAIISSQLVQVTKLLINNLTINDFDFRNFENSSLQKFYSHLQAHALNQIQVQQRPDLLIPDYNGMNKFKDVIDLVKQTAQLDLNNPLKKQQMKNQSDQQCYYQKKQKKQQPIKKNKNKQKKQIKKQINNQQDNQIVNKVQQIILQGQLKSLKITDLRTYLKDFGMDTQGKKQDLIDRVITFMSQKNQI